MKYQIDVPVTGIYATFWVDSEDTDGAKRDVLERIRNGETGDATENPAMVMDTDTWEIFQD